MPRGIPLRVDYDADDLRALARSTGDARQARRLLSLSLIYDGADRSAAARHGGVGLQTIRDWVLRFNTDGPDGLRDGTSPGAPAKLTAARKAALARVVEDGPTPCLHGLVRWRLSDLVVWLEANHYINMKLLEKHKRELMKEAA